MNQREQQKIIREELVSLDRTIFNIRYESDEPPAPIEALMKKRDALNAKIDAWERRGSKRREALYTVLRDELKLIRRSHAFEDNEVALKKIDAFRAKHKRHLEAKS